MQRIRQYRISNANINQRVFNIRLKSVNQLTGILNTPGGSYLLVREEEDSEEENFKFRAVEVGVDLLPSDFSGTFIGQLHIINKYANITGLYLLYLIPKPLK